MLMSERFFSKKLFFLPAIVLFLSAALYPQIMDQDIIIQEADINPVYEEITEVNIEETYNVEENIVEIEHFYHYRDDRWD